MISAKKYTSKQYTSIIDQDPINPWKTSERHDWTFNGDLNKAGAKRSVVFPTATSTDTGTGCSTTFYAENKKEEPTHGDIHRGHLLANSLGVGDEEAMATFSLYNVVPQFGHTNMGHWQSSVEKLAKKKIANCLRDKKPAQDAAFYLVAGTHNYTALNYSCENCQSKSVWTFDGTPEAYRYEITENCCKVTPESSSPVLAFPKTMWMAGCCWYKDIETDPATGEETVTSEPKVTTFYGWSSNLNKLQRKKNGQKGISFEEHEVGHSGLSGVDVELDPFKYTICGGQAPEGNMKSQNPGSNDESQKNLEECKSPDNKKRKTQTESQGRKKREVDQCRTWHNVVSKQSLKIANFYIKLNFISPLNNTKFAQKRAPTFDAHLHILF